MRSLAASQIHKQLGGQRCLYGSSSAEHQSLWNALRGAHASCYPHLDSIELRTLQERRFRGSPCPLVPTIPSRPATPVVMRSRMAGSGTTFTVPLTVFTVM